MSDFAKLPQPPYYAVIFTAQRTKDDEAGYQRMAVHMDELAAQQPGFLGSHSTRSADGFGITVSYWRDRAAIAAWKRQGEHLHAQQLGKDKWYARFSLQIAKVERAYDFQK